MTHSRCAAGRWTKVLPTAAQMAAARLPGLDDSDEIFIRLNLPFITRYLASGRSA
jgi:hypothetical protein